jgi:hypothetical protein
MSFIFRSSASLLASWDLRSAMMAWEASEDKVGAGRG